jgi:hypothetical protein
MLAIWRLTVVSMYCEDQLRLVADYSAAVAAYYASVSRLEQGMISGSKDIYTRLRRATEEARLVCEAARNELDEHAKTHGCGRLTERDPWQIAAGEGIWDS